MTTCDYVSGPLPHGVLFWPAGNHEYDYVSGSDRDPSGDLPYHPVWGNFGEDSGGECGAMTAGRFNMPAQLATR